MWLNRRRFRLQHWDSKCGARCYSKCWKQAEIRVALQPEKNAMAAPASAITTHRRTLFMYLLKVAVAAGIAIATLTGAAFGQNKPQEIKIGITTFLSGPASVFGVPAKAAAEMIAEDINKKGGIGGVPVKLSFVDEGAGGEALVSNYRRMVQDEKVDATFASISSGSCNQLVPVAEDLKVMNFMWDCGAASILGDQEVSLQFPHPGERHPRDAGGVGLSAQDKA